MDVVLRTKGLTKKCDKLAALDNLDLGVKKGEVLGYLQPNGAGKTTVVAYSVLGWSFMITLIASGTNISHWVLDTSVLHQVTLALAVNPNWAVDTWLFGIGVVLCLLGMWRFNSRDLQSE